MFGEKGGVWYIYGDYRKGILELVVEGFGFQVQEFEYILGVI